MAADSPEHDDTTRILPEMQRREIPVKLIPHEDATLGEMEQQRAALLTRSHLPPHAAECLSLRGGKDATKKAERNVQSVSPCVCVYERVCK